MAKVLDILRQVEPHDLRPAVDAYTGGVIIYPTDTIYGLGCDITNTQAVQRVQQIKDGTNKPMSFVCADLRDISRMRAFLNTPEGCSSAVYQAPTPMFCPQQTVRQTYLPRGNKPLDCALLTITFRWLWSKRSSSLS